MPAKEAASGLWRSEDMIKIDVIVPRDCLVDVLNGVGRLGCAQFLDLNPGVTAFGRPYASDIRRCEDTERRLRYLLEHMRASGIAPLGRIDEDDDSHSPSLALDNLERLLEQREEDLRHLNIGLDSMHAEHSRLREEYEVVTRDSTVEAGGDGGVAPQSLVIHGTIPDRQVDTFRRMVMRISRGNAILRLDAIAEPFTESVEIGAEAISKSVFAVFAASEALLRRIRRMGEALGAIVYDTTSATVSSAESIKARVAALAVTIEVSRSQKNQLLRAAAGLFADWSTIVLTSKVIFAAMNLFEYTGAIAKGQAWIPEQDYDRFVDAVAAGCSRTETKTQPIVSQCPSEMQTGHPTYFRTNRITEIFQGIVDSYGVARYKEVNPGVFTIVTFPYLFGVMYGDMGHGTLLTLFALTLVAFEKQLLKGRLNEIFAMIFGGRYLLVGMGFFATYVGVLYNDFFGMSVELFSTAYVWPKLPHEGGPMGIVHPLHPNAHPSVKPVAPYAFGIDVAWTEADNKLEFYNSTKMKCAVIIGVVQMLVGIFLSLLNHLHRKDMRHVWYAFVPEVIFLSCTFGYMSLLIIIKWLSPWPNTNLAPSLLETMTNFFLAPGVVPNPVFAGQAALQVMLLLIAFSQVPVMLVVIPYLEYHDHFGKKEPVPSQQRRSVHHDDEELVELRHAEDGAPTDEDAHHDAGGKGHDGGEHFDFSEVVIHYIIHTIEFVLGCVSNTASYLRLWALSLAHAQLSEVFLNFALLASVGADGGSGIKIYLGFAVWLGATIGVLLGMESLSAFLHALRLHWVEFQTKFYSGDGKAFNPFNLHEATRLPF